MRRSAQSIEAYYGSDALALLRQYRERTYTSLPDWEDEVSRLLTTVDAPGGRL
jgi:hypothetical protein